MQYLTHPLLRGLASRGGLGVPRREQSSGTGVEILGEYSKSATGDGCPCATDSALLPPREKRGWEKNQTGGRVGHLRD